MSDDWVHSITQGNCRCIVLERPGYGESSPILLKNIGDWIPIIQSFIRELAITSADVIGCSAGAPYAYATALALPEVVKKVFILGGVPVVYEEKILSHYDEQDIKAYQNFVNQHLEETQQYYWVQMEDAAKRMEPLNLP